MAVVMITAKATIPMNMLGKPNTELCGVCMTCPQEIHGFTSQTVTWFGSFRTFSFSSTRAPDASQPMTPVISRSQANGRSRVIVGRARHAGAGPDPVGARSRRRRCWRCWAWKLSPFLVVLTGCFLPRL